MIKEYWSSFNIENCLNELLDKGFVKLPSIKEINLEKFSKNIISDLDGSTFAELPRSHQEFLDFFELEKHLAPKLFEIAVKKYKFKGKNSNQYHISRMIIPGNNKESFRTHFDSHLFTMVIPLKIPKRKKSNQHIGELFFFPALRNHPRNEFINFLGKLWFKRYASKEGIQKLSQTNSFMTEDFLNYQPLLFLGNTFLHANHTVSNDVDESRLTLLAHFFDPSPTYGIGNLLRIVRKR